jgi:hypothetical protein
MPVIYVFMSAYKVDAPCKLVEHYRCRRENCVQHFPSWAGDSRSASQEIACFYGTWRFTRLAFISYSLLMSVGLLGGGGVCSPEKEARSWRELLNEALRNLDCSSYSARVIRSVRKNWAGPTACKRRCCTLWNCRWSTHRLGDNIKLDLKCMRTRTDRNRWRALERRDAVVNTPNYYPWTPRFADRTSFETCRGVPQFLQKLLGQTCHKAMTTSLYVLSNTEHWSIFYNLRCWQCL